VSSEGSSPDEASCILLGLISQSLLMIMCRNSRYCLIFLVLWDVCVEVINMSNPPPRHYLLNTPCNEDPVCWWHQLPFMSVETC
jgi:hypothetical protein